MPNKFYRFSRWVLQKIACHRGYSLTIITMIIWGGLQSLGSNGANSDPNFGWQIVLFTFVIATLLLAINPASLSNEKQVTAFKTTGFMMMFSGIIMIGGYGMLTSGFANVKDHALSGAIFGMAGLGVLMAAWILLALGLSIMAVESAEILLETFGNK